jgi:hypothetical protein
MNTINRTFSIPIHLDRDLNRFVKKRGMSRFVSEALRKGLEEKRNSLKKAYKMASEDEGQNAAYQDWSETMGDGTDVDNEW